MVLCITAIWIILDGALWAWTSTTSGPMTPTQGYVIFGSGLAFGIFAFIAEWRAERSRKREAEQHDHEMKEQTHQLSERLATQDKFLTAIGAITARTLSVVESPPGKIREEELGRTVRELQGELAKLKIARSQSFWSERSDPPFGSVLDQVATVHFPTIRTPKDGAEVKYAEEVTGFGAPKVPVQVWVRRVGQPRQPYYLQGTVIPETMSWSMKCSFGKEDTPAGVRFEVIALMGQGLPSNDQLRVLPPGFPTSEVVTVKRRVATINDMLKKKS